MPDFKKEELENLREHIRELQRQHKDDRRHEEERQRRKKEDDFVNESQASTLFQFLTTCHSLGLPKERMPNETLSVQHKDTNKRIDRFCPRRIIPWTTFAEKQEDIWHELSSSPSFASQATFPSVIQLNYAKFWLTPVCNEFTLRNYHQSMVETPVQELIYATNNDPLLRSSLGLGGTVMFEADVSFGTGHESLPKSTEKLPTGMAQNLRPPNQPTQYRKARGKGNEVAHFCLYHTSDGRKMPIVATEYKPSHKLTRDEIITGLVSEIQPARDIINKDGQGFAFSARRLVTAAITQLFSYMIGKGVRYGYIYTGEVYIFLHIPEDPSCVYYSICVPSLDAQGSDETSLHRTAVAQVFAFTLQAIRSSLPSQAWHIAAEDLDRWFMGYEDVLGSIPVTVRQNKPACVYKPQPWAGFIQHPTQTHSTSLPLDGGAQQPSDDDRENDKSLSPTQDHDNHQTPTSSVPEDIKSSDRREAQLEDSTMHQNIQNRPYCTHKCLHGLMLGNPLDEECPNFTDHGSAHITQQQFLHLISNQLAEDCGSDADCVPLYLSGSRGSLFKVRLSSHGYTVIAKGMEELDIKHLKHENEIYDHIQSLQGKYVPVCLGTADLIRPYYYDCGIFKHFLFLSYGGQSTLKCVGQVKTEAIDEIVAGCIELHKLRVLHSDVELRNVLYDVRDNKCMIVDFERAQIRPHGPTSQSNRHQERKRYRQKIERDEFTMEVQYLQEALLRCVSSAD